MWQKSRVEGVKGHDVARCREKGAIVDHVFPQSIVVRYERGFDLGISVFSIHYSWTRRVDVSIGDIYTLTILYKCFGPGHGSDTRIGPLIGSVAPLHKSENKPIDQFSHTRAT